MIALTEEQRQRVLEANGGKLRVVDPSSGQEYVLVRVEVFERFETLLGDNFEPSEAYPAIDRSFAEGWTDSKMDDYDRYEEITKR